MERTFHDLKIQVDRDKIFAGDDAMEAKDGIDEQVNTAVAAEVVQQPYAYVEWLKASAMCVKRAHLLGTRQGMGGDIYRSEAPEAKLEED